MSHTQDAFDVVCRQAKQARGYYVSLMARSPFYGGPEEGGWWGEDTHVVAYQHFPTEDAAQAALGAVEALARALEAEALKTHGQLCLRQLDWCEDRGLEADYLPENDGPDDYYVLMTEGLPEGSQGVRHYE